MAKTLTNIAEDAVLDALEDGYNAMAADEEHEEEALEWIEGVVADVADDPS